MTGPDGVMKADGTFLLPDGSHLIYVHDASKCEGRPCVIHNPSDHVMRSFPLHWRDDNGLLERICPHGVGHPDPDALAYLELRGFEAMGIHGCDGCCSPLSHPAHAA